MKRLHIFIVAILMVSLLSVESLLAQTYSVPTANVDIENKSIGELWDMANTAYANDDFISAEEYYRAILDRDLHSSDLYYNLGNVYYKRGDIALSLLNYYRALKLNPSDDDICYNIEVAQSKTADNIEQVPQIFIIEWSEWVGSRLSCMQWSVLSLVFLAIALAFTLVYFLTASLRNRRFGFLGGVITLIIFVLTTRHALIARDEILDPSEAIVMSGSMSVTSSPSSASTELFILHEGTKVQILSVHDDWSEIMIDDGKKGWVESRKIEQI